MQNNKTKGEIFLAVSIIILGVLGLIAKIYAHVGEWKPGQIVKTVIIASATILGVYLLIRKKPEE